MRSSRLRATVLLGLLGLSAALLEAAAVHTDDGCVLETHCNACMLGLRAPGLVTTAFTLPRALPVAVSVPAAATPQPRDAAPRALASRGPPAPSR